MLSNRKFPFLSALCLTIVGFWLSSEAYSQKGAAPGFSPLHAIRPVPRNLKGTIIGMSARTLMIDAPKDDYRQRKHQPYIHIIPGRTRISVNGTADSSVLIAGRYIRFTAPLDSDGKVTAEIEQLSLVAPPQKEAERIVPDEASPMRSVIIGKITAVAGQKLTLDVQPNSLKIRNLKAVVSKEPKITLEEAPDHSLAEPGDEISVKGAVKMTLDVVRGIAFVTWDHGEIVAEEIVITLSKPAHFRKVATKGRLIRNSSEQDATNELHSSPL